MSSRDKTHDLAQRISSAVFKRVELEYHGAVEDDLVRALSVANPFGPEGATYWQDYCFHSLCSQDSNGSKQGATPSGRHQTSD